MRTARTAILRPLFSTMELCWLYAFLHFSLAAATHRTFPLVALVCCHAAAVFLAVLVEGRGLRGVWILAIQTTVGSCWVWGTLGLIHFQSTTALNPMNFLNGVRAMPGMEQCVLAQTGFGLIMGWLGGRLIGRSGCTYRGACRRFDIGLVAFGTLFMAQFLMWIKAGIHMPDGVLIWLLGSFVLFGLAAVALARLPGGQPREFISGCGAMAMTLGMVLGVILCATVIWLWMPVLSRTAEAGYDVLRNSVSPVAQFIGRGLKFLFIHSRHRPYDLPRTPGPAGPGGAGPAIAGEPGIWQSILQWGVVGTAALLIALTSAVLLFHVLRRLWKPTEKHAPAFQPLKLLWRWILSVRDLIRSGAGHRKSWNRGNIDAGRLYAAVTGWGRRSGLPLAAGETPGEYSRRLTRHFPALDAEIDILLTWVQHQAYGGAGLDRHQADLSRRAWARMRSPSQWPRRIRNWLHPPAA